MFPRVLHDRIIVKPFPPDEQSVGGIYLPENIRERSSKALIFGVGGGKKDKPMRYREGYTVWHIKGAGQEVIHEGTSYFIMQSNDVLAYKEN